jgi:large subunit ribosomal protein L21
MLAVIKLGGLQHIVKANDVIKVNKLPHNVGDEFEINEVLSTINGAEVKIGAPVVSGASVKAKILEQGKDDKVIIFKKKRRQNYRRQRGHRQEISTIQILSVK